MEVQKCLGYISINSIMKMITQGMIQDCPVTPQDMLNALKIYGPPVPALKGKTRDIQVKIPKEIPTFYNIQSELKMEADIMFINGKPFVISVTTLLGLTIVSAVAARDYNSLKTAL